MKSLLLSLFLVCSLPAFATDSMVLEVDSNSPEFSVTLSANPTTGFMWTVTRYDKAYLLLKDSQYLAPKTTLIGAGGQMVFTFARVKDKPYPKSTRVVFKYGRSWEPAGGFEKQVTIHFTNDALQKTTDHSEKSSPK